MRRIILIVSFVFICLQGRAQEVTQAGQNSIKPFIAYELGEAAFNKFQSYSGEIGIIFPSKRLLRLVHLNVNLTEGHLSSSFAGAVDGPDVEGLLFGFEVFYDFPITDKGFYIAPSIGYFKNEYSHIILDEELKNMAATLGVGLSYRELNIFGLQGLYINLSVPLRISLNPIEETSLGETVIVNSTFDNNILFFVGYQF